MIMIFLLNYLLTVFRFKLNNNINDFFLSLFLLVLFQTLLLGISIGIQRRKEYEFVLFKI